MLVVTVRYIPHYSRALSPIEEAFFKSSDDYSVAIELRFDSITTGNCDGCYRHTPMHLELLPKIKELIATVNKSYPQLEDDHWVHDLAFLSNITGKLYES